MSGKPGGDEEAGDTFDFVDNRHRVWSDVHQASPGFGDLEIGEDGEGAGQDLSSFGQDTLFWLRIENADRLEGRCLVQRPSSRGAQFLPATAAKAQPNFVTAGQQPREKVRQQSEMIRRQFGGIGIAPSDRISAVESLTQCENRAGSSNVRASGQWIGAENRSENLQLRQIQSGIAGEQSRPGAARENGCVATYPTALGNDADEPTVMQIDSPDGTVRENLRTLIPRGFGNRGRRMGWFSAPVSRSMKARDESGAGARHDCVEFLPS